MSKGNYQDEGKSLTRRTFLSLAGGSLLSVSLPFALSNVASAASGPVKVGGIFSLTGPNAPVGKTIRDGARLAVHRINEQGGIGGKIKLDLIVQDGETSQVGASKAARRLVNRGDISFALGPLIGTHARAAQPIFGAAGIPQIFFGTDPGFTERHAEYPLSIRYGTQVKLQSAPVLKYAVEERGDEELYLLVPNDDPGKRFEKVVRNQLARLPGGELVDTSYYVPFGSDFSSLITKVMSSRAEGVIVGDGIPANLIAVARELDRRGVDMQQFGYYTGQTPNGSVDFEKQVAAKGIGDGIIYSWHYENGDYSREFERSDPPAQAKMMESAFVDKYGHPPDSPPSASWGWGSMYIIKQAIEGMIKDRGKNAVMEFDRQEELPREAISYLLPSDASTNSGPVIKTPYGNYGFLSCGQFNIRLGVATFKDKRRHLLKDRGYGEDIMGPLC